MTKADPSPPKKGGAFADEDDAALPPQQERIVRQVRLMLVFGALIIFGGFGVVLATVIARLDGSGEAVPDPIEAPAAMLAERGYVAPPGSRITAIALDGDRAVIGLETADGPKVLLVDLTTLEPVGEKHLGE